MATKKTPDDGGNARVEFPVSADKHRLVVKAQREFIGSIADRVEKGESFKRADERKMIAGILRAWARQIPDAPPDARSGAANPGHVAIHFAWLVNGQGQGKPAAIAELAEIYGVSPEAVSEAIAKFEGPAMRLVPAKG